MEQLIYELLYLIPTCIATICFGTSYMDISISRGKLSIVALVICFFYLLCKRLDIKGKIIVLAIPIIAMALIFFLQQPEKRYAFIESYIWIAIMSGVTCGCIIISNLFIRLRKLSIVFMLFLIALLLGNLLWGVRIPATGSTCIYALLLLLVIEEIQAHWQKKGYTDNKKHLLYISPFLLLCVLPLVFIRAPKEPYQWKHVRNLYCDLKQSIYNVLLSLSPQNSGAGANAIVGMSDEGYILGNITKTPENLMSVTYYGDVSGTVYLIGKVFDTFDGKQWTTANTSLEDDRGLDLLETYYNICRYSPDAINDLFMMNRIHVSYSYYSTQFAFIPLKCDTTSSLFEEINATQQGCSFYLPTYSKEGFHYAVTFGELNEKNPDLPNLSNQSVEDNPAIWNETLEHYNLAQTDGYSYEDLLAHRKHIYKTYLPYTTLSPTATETFDALLKDATNNYEKLQRIDALLSSFEYSLNAGALPESVVSSADFIDYFMSEKKGSCGHYASAFVVLARSQGIPARYVQGFTVPVNKSYPTTVTSSMAHAWAEAYIDGIGWVRFDPTPSYDSTTGWDLGSNRQEAIENETEEKPEEEAESLVQAIWGNKRIRIALAISILAFFVLSVILFYLDRRHARKRYEKSTESDKIRFLYKQNMMLLTKLKLAIRPNETLNEYALRAKEALHSSYAAMLERPQQIDELLSFLPIYEETIYREKEMEESDRIKVWQSHIILLHLIHETHRLYAFFYKIRNI